MKKLIVSILIGVLMLSPIAYAKEYQLIPGDTLEIKIINHQSLDTKQAIAPDGTVSLPLLGRVKAEGENLESFQNGIQKQFSRYIENPQVVMYISPIKTEQTTTADAKQEPIFIIINDIGKKTFEVKKAATVIEARALANNYPGEIKPGDIITIKVGQESSFWKENWHTVITTGILVASFISRH
jgi:polysaccharide export outer membrane protein